MKIRDNFGDLIGKRQVKGLKIEYQFTWVLKDLRNYHHCPGHHDESPIFSMGLNNEYEWKLNIYINGCSNTGYIDIRPILVNKTTHDKAKFFFDVSVLDKTGQEQNTRRLTLTMENLHLATGTIQFCGKEALLNDPNLYANGELKLLCRFSFDAPITPAEETIEMQYFQCYQKSQLDNFERLYGSEEFSDFKLVIGKSEVPVHQAILATRSSVFKAMFLSSMRESKEKKVEIEDVDPEIMKKVLRYIYSGRVNNIYDVADKVLPVADKYQLDALKQICEDMLVDQLTIENIYNMLEFSDNYNAKYLKTMVIDFFNQNFEKLAAVDDFKSTISLLSANLQTDLICASAKKN